jgi:hypothetical protein
MAGDAWREVRAELSAGMEQAVREELMAILQEA